MRTLIAATLLAGVLVGAEPPEDLHPCATATTTCTGTVSVPLDRADPASERIDVTFVRVPRTDLSTPATGTVLAHLGGPGPSLGTERVLVEQLGPALEHQDLVVADLRGTGRSSPISCTGVNVDVPETVADCGRQLGERGAFFTTEHAVADYDAVRAALGVDEVTLFGNSYGSLWAQAYASRFPERVAAVYLNGIVPADDGGFGSPGGPYESVAAVSAQIDVACEAAPACAALPGDTAERLARVADDLRAAGADVSRLVSVLENAGFEPRPGRDLSAALDAHLRGDPAPLRRLLDAVVPPRVRGVLPPERAGYFLTLNCGDARLPFDRGAPVEQRRAQLQEFYDDELPYAPFTRDEAEAGSYLANTADLCVEWPLLRDKTPVRRDVALPDVPVLQVGGLSDPSVVVDGGATARRFERSTVVEIPYGTHQTWDDDHPVDGRCANSLMRDFVADPRVPMDQPGCDWTTFTALGSFPRDLAGLPELRGVAPESGGLVTAAFATVADATLPLHTTEPGPPTEYTEAGVRGGSATLAAGVVTLSGARFVADVAVDGTVTVDPEHRATATLTVTGPDGVPTPMTLSWDLLDAADPVPVTVDGRPLATDIPRF